MSSKLLSLVGEWCLLEHPDDEGMDIICEDVITVNNHLVNNHLALVYRIAFANRAFKHEFWSVSFVGEGKLMLCDKTKHFFVTLELENGDSVWMTVSIKDDLLPPTVKYHVSTNRIIDVLTDYADWLMLLPLYGDWEQSESHTGSINTMYREALGRNISISAHDRAYKCEIVDDDMQICSVDWHFNHRGGIAKFYDSRNQPQITDDNIRTSDMHPLSENIASWLTDNGLSGHIWFL